MWQGTFPTCYCFVRQIDVWFHAFIFSLSLSNTISLSRSLSPSLSFSLSRSLSSPLSLSLPISLSRFRSLYLALSLSFSLSLSLSRSLSLSLSLLLSNSCCCVCVFYVKLNFGKIRSYTGLDQPNNNINNNINTNDIYKSCLYILSHNRLAKVLSLNVDIKVAFIQGASSYLIISSPILTRWSSLNNHRVHTISKLVYIP